MKNTYCIDCLSRSEDDINRIYHDSLYGFPVSDDNELFGRLILEINQAGLSWTTILNKAINFKRAYDEFNIEKIAAYNETKISELLSDAGIIRNKLKVNAAIHNAQVIVELKQEYGSFKDWLDYNHPLSKPEWVKLFKKTFKFTGGEITGEFLMSTGYLEGAHDPLCPIYSIVKQLNPKWSTNL